VGRRFSDAAVHLALGSYPGFHLTAPPGAASPYGVFRSVSMPASGVPHVAVLPDGSRVDIPSSPVAVPAGRALAPVPEPDVPRHSWSGGTCRAPLGRVAAARSGDKGGDANLGVWVEDDRAWPWLAHMLTRDAVRALLPETADHEIERYVFPNLRAVNVVVRGLLGEGVAYNARFDPQAKALGEWLRARFVEIPRELLSREAL
jgi:hypothetical protein